MNYISRTLLLLSLSLLLFAGCGEDVGREPVISVSIAPLGWFLSEIGGDGYRVNVMVPPGADPHTYEPSPSAVSDLGRSSVWVSNSYLDFDMAWGERFMAVNPEMKRVDMAEGQDLLHAREHRHGDHVHYEGVDPHFWLSPLSASIMATAVRDMFIEFDPDNSDLYNSNWRRVAAVIDSVQKEAANRLEPYAGESFFIYHPVLAYYARDFGLEQVPVEYDGKEPSPARLRGLIDKGRKLGIGAILVQEEFDVSSARVIASDIGAGVRIIYPLSPDWPGAVMDITDALVESFGEAVKRRDQGN